MSLPVAEPSSRFHAMQRRLAALLPGGAATGGDVPLEVATPSSEPPRLITAIVLESGPMRARRVVGQPAPAFAAFLDGTQTSRVLAYADGLPVIHGTVAAAVRVRRNRRMVTWGQPLVRSALYAPRALLSAAANGALDAMDASVVDTTAIDPADVPTAHPYAVRDAAIHLVQKDRETAERELAERWCGLERDPLLIDGGISGSERVAVSSCTVGVVKSHRTLYAEGEALQVVLGLRRGERSSVFRITSPKRTTVASWYLRLREPAGHDPMWGLVRVEIAQPPRAEEPGIGRRADEVSRWLLAEAAPLSLPDGRWDKMVYGVFDCENFLKAIV